MNGSDLFTEVIKSYLDDRAKEDALFAESYAKEGKSIDECIAYILNQVKASGRNGFADEEIFSMAVHYYDEENIDVGKTVNCQIVVNHKVELTDEEKAQARKDAVRAYQEAEMRKMRERGHKPKAQKETEAIQQLSLF